MKITDIKTHVLTTPLNTVFKTALRTVDAVENILVTMFTDASLIGFGSAAPTSVITGETIASITGAIAHIRDCIIGMDIKNHELLFQQLNRCMVGNNSAKAAVDMAIFDILAKSVGVPLFRLLGGEAHAVETDMTISLDETPRMVDQAQKKIDEGFKVLKIKVGGDVALDIERLTEVHKAAKGKVTLRIDANQGWNPKEAVFVGKTLEQKNIPIDLMEQPVAAENFAGMAFVRQNIPQPVYADESIFSAADALELIQMKAVDGINIKLMKCGGIYNALKIAAIAETAGIPCMIGSMMECNVSVTAAAHLAAARSIITSFDLDAPLFFSRHPGQGGISYQGPRVVLPEAPGLGIRSLKFK